VVPARAPTVDSAARAQSTARDAPTDPGGSPLACSALVRGPASGSAAKMLRRFARGPLIAADAFERAGIAPDARRAEDLSVVEWGRLAEASSS